MTPVLVRVQALMRYGQRSYVAFEKLDNIYFFSECPTRIK